MTEWDDIASENRGTAEALVVLQEYVLESENKDDINKVINRLHMRLDWTVYRLKQLGAPTDQYIDPTNLKTEPLEKKDE